jgi:hypothetical protein
MSRRRWLLFGVVILFFATLCALETQRIVTGWLRGEAFYRGRPTTYWRGQLTAWQQENPWEEIELDYAVTLAERSVKSSTLILDKDVAVTHYSPMNTRILVSASTDPIQAATLLGEGLACATSPTPFLIVRPHSETYYSAVMVDPMSIDLTSSTFLLAQPRPEKYWDRFTAWLGLAKEENPTRPALLEGDADAEPVLQQLVDDPQVGRLARHALRTSGQKANP